MQETILVTGGAGFIGSALAEKLHGLGAQVVIIDDFNDYYDITLKRDRIARLPDDITVIEGTLADVATVEKLFADHAFTKVCHLAASAGVRYSIEHPRLYVENNVTALQTLLEAMMRHGVKHLVFASSSSVYGTDTEAPFHESATADRPVSLYAASKRAGELITHTYHNLYGINTTCLRFFTVYGPWSRPDMAMLSFAQKIVAGKEIEIFNHGDLRRDFTYVDDIVDGFTLAVENPQPYEIINLGNGSPIPLLTFVETLETCLQKEAIKKLVPMQPGDVFETYADISKAQSLLGYQPKVDFTTGVQHFSDWFMEYYR